jgi:DNA-binding YbaB/EbfC family protein
MTMFSKLKQIKDLRDQAKKIQDVLKDVSAEGQGGWGKVKVTISGNLEIQSVAIDPELLADRAKTETGVKEAANDAIKKVQRSMAEEMRKNGNLNIPGLS